MYLYNIQMWSYSVRNASPDHNGASPKPVIQNSLSGTPAAYPRTTLPPPYMEMEIKRSQLPLIWV